MMDQIFRAVSLIFHPILMPLLGVVFYFSKTPRFIPEGIVQAKLFSISILTIILPILLFYLLKTIKKVNSVYLETTQERILPLLLHCAITTLILLRVFPKNEIPELYFFFIGVLVSSIGCLILALLKFKSSIHIIAFSGVFMFAIGLSIHFKININGTIALMSIVLGAIATSRLHLKAHTPIELIVGLIVGALPQLMLSNYWL